MVDWQITATTVICDSSGEEVTLIIDNTGQGRCTGTRQSKAHNKPPYDCLGETCPQVIGYRDRIMAEENDLD